MQGVSSCLSVKSVRLKIEKKLLRSIKHGVQVEDERLTKSIGFGWYDGIEGKVRKGK